MAGENTVTLYCVNGLDGGETDWLGAVLPAFTAQTDIAVHYVEDHSRDIVRRLMDSGLDDTADVLITLPPFVQLAAREGLLDSFRPDAASTLPEPSGEFTDKFHLLVRDFPTLIYNKAEVVPALSAYTDLLSDRFRGKIQYSRPGWSGAGTAFMLQVFHAFGGKDAGLAFLKALQANCLPPTDHTSRLAGMVDSGELLVGNGDIQTNLPQMADNPNIDVVFPMAPNGIRYAFELSYYIGLATRARNKANGVRLINYLLAEEAQMKVSAVAQGLPARQDIQPTDEKYRWLSGKLRDVEIWKPDWSAIAATLDDDVADYDRIVLD